MRAAELIDWTVIQRGTDGACVRSGIPMKAYGGDFPAVSLVATLNSTSGREMCSLIYGDREEIQLDGRLNLVKTHLIWKGESTGQGMFTCYYKKRAGSGNFIPKTVDNKPESQGGKPQRLSCGKTTPTSHISACSFKESMEVRCYHKFDEEMRSVLDNTPQAGKATKGQK